jgi:hypothetical protein
MVVKAATKKWFMDNGLDEHTAHLWADGKRREELLKMNFDETMNHLYWNCYNRLKRWGDDSGDMLDRETFFRDGPPKDISFYPFTMTFRDFIGINPHTRHLRMNIRYDDFIYEYIQRLKRHLRKRLITTYSGAKLLREKGDLEKLIKGIDESMGGWGVRLQRSFMNYDTLPFNEKS